MIGALIILLVTVGVGLLLYVSDLKYRRKHPITDGETEEKEIEKEDDHGEICCGRHLICEKPLTPQPGEEIIYYDDEELDRFAGKNADEFTDEESDEVREVMMTLLPEDVAGWSRSIQVREINLPEEVRDELLLIVSDMRGN